ncbi:MAG TPA: ParB/RepB/Spo0J family partition protein [Pseudomonadales bacterium]|jgi:ParB family chromosome partitioning protein
MSTKKRGLGKGLDALIGRSTAKASAPAATPEPTDGALRELPIDLLQRGRYQPRRDMKPEALEELANSIRAQGVMQPIVVRPIPGDRFEIIAGERRWRASQMAGLEKVPALIRDVPDEAAIAMALIENIQREDLNAMEEAQALKRLQDEFGLTHQQVADAVGKSRATVSNLLRLLALNDDVQKLLDHGDLEMGHARALLSLEGRAQSEAARQVVSKGLSVRQTEALVRNQGVAKPAKPAKSGTSADIRRLEEDLSEKVGVPVSVQHSASGKGKLVLSYNNLDELDGILSHIK